MFPRQGSPVPHELLPPHIRCCQSSATSIFQPSPSRHTMTSLQHARPSGVLRHWSDSLECAAWRPPRPIAQCRHFQEEAKDTSVSECTWTLSALEALCNVLYKFKTYLLTYLHQAALGYWHQRADERHGNLPQGNQELLVVRDKVERPQVSWGKQVHGMWYFPYSALTLLVGRREGHPACKQEAQLMLTTGSTRL